MTNGADRDVLLALGWVSAWRRTHLLWRGGRRGRTRLRHERPGSKELRHGTASARRGALGRPHGSEVLNRALQQLKQSGMFGLQFFPQCQLYIVPAFAAGVNPLVDGAVVVL